MKNFIVLMFLLPILFAASPLEDVIRSAKLCVVNSRSTMGNAKQFVELKSGKKVLLGKKVGAGEIADVYCEYPGCANVYKVYRSGDLNDIRQELEATGLVKEAGIPHARVVRSTSDFIVKEFIPGPSLLEVLKNRRLLTEEIDALVDIYFQCKKAHITIDFYPTNFILDLRSPEAKWVLIDTDKVGLEMPVAKEWAEKIFQRQEDRETFLMSVRARE